MAADPKYTIAKLNSGNYQLWKFKIEMLLSNNDLWEVVEQPIPAQTTQEWEKKNRKAKATISLTVEDDQLIHIREEESAAGMWNALKKVHERRNLCSKLYLLRKLYKLRLESESGMQQHINAALELAGQLRGRGEDIQDSHLVAMLLCRLPESYASLITALEARAEDELTLEFVTGKLIDEAERRKENAEAHAPMSESALKTNATGERPRRETRECFVCKRVGHLKKNCRVWKAQQEKQRPHKVKNAIREATTDHRDDDESEVCFKACAGQMQQGWYIDSGATSHMTSNPKFFEKLEGSKGDKITLADGSSIDSEGVGVGHLNCENSQGNSQRILLKEVLYVPKLKGNLLSVKRLTTQTFEGNQCTISKGRRVIATGKSSSHLYQLGEDESARIADTHKHNECIHLWHRRLGHRGPEAIKELAGNDLVEGLRTESKEM